VTPVGWAAFAAYVAYSLFAMAQIHGVHRWGSGTRRTPQ